MAYFRTCPYCKANLDPGEVCDCRENAASAKKEQKRVFTWAEIRQLVDQKCLEARYKRKKGA